MTFPETAPVNYQWPIENSPDSVFVLDREYRYTFFNNIHAELMKSLFGMKIQIGHALSEYLLHPDSWKMIRSYLDQVLSGVPVHTSGWRKRRFFEIHAFPIHSMTGEVQGISLFASDHTEAKKVQQKEIESVYFFKESQSAAFIGSYKANFVTDRWETSEILDQIFGLEENSPKGLQVWLDIVHPDDREMMRNYLQNEVIAKHQPFDKEYRILRKSDGALRWLRGLGRVNFDNDGKVIALVGTVQDITQQKYAEEARLRSDIKFRLIFENASDGILLADTATKRFVIGNNKIVQMLGYDLSEIQNLTVTDIHPKDDLPAVLAAFQKQQRLESSLAENLPVLRKDGSVFYCDINSFPLYLDGREMLIGFFRDITERKRVEEAVRAAEEKYRALVETTDTGYQILDDAGRVLDANQEYLRLSGHSSLSEIQGRRVIEWTAEHDLQRNAEAVSLCLKNGGIRNLIIDYVDKHGRFTPVEINATLQKTENSFHIIALCRDISERKRTEKEKLEMQAQLLHASKLASIGTLAAGVAHEINNPLMIIVGCCEAMLRNCTGPAKEDDQNLLHTIQEASTRVAEIVKGLRTYARQDGQSLDNVDMHLCISETVALIRGMFEKEKIKIEMHLDAHNFLLEANTGKLQQVIMNLMGNAKDALGHTQKGLIRITTRDQNDALQIEICDNGTGIPAPLLPRIFDPFFTTKDSGKGTGLGLSICNTIISSFGGSIYVESQEGQGTTFTILIPRHQSANTIREKNLPVDQDLKISAKALIVDDENMIREILTAYLSSFGMKVSQAEDGEAAYQILLSEHFDYIFTDLKMANMSGKELLSKLKSEKLAQDTKIVVITGNMLEETSEKMNQSLGLKVDAYLCKPFKRNDIIPVLKALMK